MTSLSNFGTIDGYMSNLGGIVKRILTTAAGVASSAALIGIITATPAAAQDVDRWCSTTGASGGIIVYNYNQPEYTVALTMNAYDALADDHHVSVRLLTKNYAGTIKYWPWHANYHGVGTNLNWDTTATNNTGIHDVGVQIARFEGSTLLNSCTDWTS
ncbi:hypothetical protein AB5J56_24900 [Streptomyces sp. R21]|uniref:Uncharacterized protein n=1 Tax=Streptomyces sp. R21 TaxID=3238627 RepID=A0AB39PBB4_9ACTN